MGHFAMATAWSFGHRNSGPVMLCIFAEQLPNHRWHIPFAEQNKADGEIEWASFRPSEKNFGSAGAIPAQFPGDDSDGMAD